MSKASVGWKPVNHRCVHILALAITLSLMVWLALSTHQPRTAADAPMDAPQVAKQMAEAVGNFFAALDPDQRRRATYLMKDEERRNFHFFPIPRRGVPLKDLNAAQRQLAHALVSTGLSQRGYMKAVTIMSLGQILRDLDPEDRNVYRDSDQYYFTIFGDPDPEGTWGWRVEGFHLSLNFTIVEGRWIAVAPSFFGSLPATVKRGPREGLQVLRNEEEMGRRLAKSLDREQRKIAFGPVPEFKETVGGLITGNARKIEPAAPRGLPASKMNPQQVELLMDLVREYAHRHRRELAELDLAKLAQAGTKKIHFAWGGGLHPGEPHHYMIQGPTFLIEYDNTQDNANHVHSVWRDYENDFGDDLLRRHYERHHSK